MPLYLKDGKLLVENGKLGTGAACCCGKCFGPCDVANPCHEECCCVDGTCVPNPDPGQPCPCSGPCDGENPCPEGCACVDGQCVTDSGACSGEPCAPIGEPCGDCCICAPIDATGTGRCIPEPDVCYCCVPGEGVQFSWGPEDDPELDASLRNVCSNQGGNVICQPQCLPEEGVCDNPLP